MMVARAEVGQARALFSATKQETELDQIDARLAALQRKSPNKIGGKQVFAGGLIRVAHRMRQQRGQSSCIRADVTQYLVKFHRAKWESLSEATRAAWEDRAASRQVEEWDKLNEGKGSLKRRKTDLELVMQESAYDGPWLLSRCKCTKEEVAQFDNMWHDSKYSHSQVEREYQQYLEPLEPLTEHEVALLAARPEPPRERSGSSPAWAAMVCRHKEHFKDSVLHLTYEGQGFECHLMLCWALMSPLVCAFADVAPVSGGVATGSEADPLRGWGVKRFRILGKKYSMSTDGEYAAPVKARALAPCSLQGAGALASTAGWVDFEQFVEGLARPAAEARPQGPERLPPRSSLPQAVLEEHPWLLDTLPPGRSTLAGPGSQGSCEALAADLEAPQGWVEEFEADATDPPQRDAEGKEAPLDVEDVLARLAAKRGGGRGGSGAWPRALPHGGPGREVHHGEIQRRLQRVPSAGQDQGGEPVAAPVRRADFGHLYMRKVGEALARVCALYWAEKMSHFHSLWCARAQGSYEYSPEDLASSPEPRAITEAFEAASPECRKRMSDLRAMVPRKPIG